MDDYLSLRHPYFDESVRMAEQLQVHSRGLAPTEMLEIARPNEKPEYLAYRKKVYKPFTRTYWAKVAGTGQKIVKAEDWNIDYSKARKSVLVSSLSLEDYMENSYPEFDSFTNFWFSFAISLYYDDPNAVIAFLPLDLTGPDNELRKPYAHTFESDQVLDFVDRKYCVLLDSEKSLVRVGDKEEPLGNIFHLLDETTYIKCVQKGRKEDNLYDEYILPHGGEYLPAFKVGRKIHKRNAGRTLYESDMSPCLPYWDEAISDISDHQVNKKLHLHPDRWEIADTECPTCSGKGKVQQESRKPGMRPFENVTCGTCNGMGVISVKSPFNTKYISVSKKSSINSDTPIPTPPAGYIERPIESIDFLKKEVRDNLIQGLAALNMEHLFEEPLTNSGVAKTVDRQEFLSYIQDVARHFVENVFNASYEFSNNWRYGYQNTAQRYAQLPSINIPQKFDLLTLGVLSARLAEARAGKFSSDYVSGLELQLARMEFGKDSTVVKKLELKHKLDPLPYLTPAEKNESVLNSSAPATSYQNYVISSNLDAFITRALEENRDFYTLTYTEQVAIMRTYAAEIKPQTISLPQPEPITTDATDQATNDNPLARQAG